MSTARTDPAEAEQLCAAATPADGCSAELGWGLSVVGRAFTQWASESVADLPGGPRGHLVLATIAQGHPRSQLALANALGVDRTVMTYLLDELETAGLLERRPDPADRRARQIHITPAGRTTLRDSSARLREAEQRLLAPLDANEALAFRGMIERVARATQATGGSSCTEGAAACPDAS